MRQNALWNCKNPHQGNMTRALCVCSAGLLRSPTIAWVLGNHNYNTRAIGIHDYALIQIDDVLLHWADEIICADGDIFNHVLKLIGEKGRDIPVYNLNIPDNYSYRDPKLVSIIETKLKDIKLI